MRVPMLVSLLALDGCFEAGTFVCVDAASCVSEQGPGQCEANGRCSYPDRTCASGKRWGEFAGSLAGKCFECPAAPAGIAIAGLDGDISEVGGALAGVGDFDGDGFADLAVGAARLQDFQGGVGIVWGSDAPFDASMTDDGLGGAGILLTGGAADSYAGTRLAGLGDLNADGRGDLLVGAPGYTGAVPRSGRAYVVFGGAEGFALNTLPNDDGVVVFDSTAQEQAGLGRSLTAAGDIDGDGAGDIAIVSGLGAGSRVHVVSGTVPLAKPEIDVAVDGFTVAFPAVSDGGALAVRGVGDVDGDGFADLTVSAPQDEAAWILFGPVSVSGSIDEALVGRTAVRLIHERFLVLGRGADANGDGLGDFAVAAPSDRQGDGAAYLVFGRTEREDVVLGDLAATGAVVYHGSLGESLGESIDFGTDFDCDGIPDLVVGSPDWNPDGAAQSERPGRAHVLSGRDSPGSIETAALGEGVRRIENPDLARRRFGETVAFVGDINGDGLGDLAIGAPSLNGGAAHVFYGGSPAEPPDE